MNSYKKIDSLQVLRALACIAIFAFHNKISMLGPWGVSIFIMLSGFLMYYKYNERNIDSSIRSSFQFSIKRIIKLYPLHIVTMMIMVVLKFFSIVGSIEHTTKGFVVFGGQILSNIFLIQSWIPNNDFCYSLNGISWYLSTALFLYLVFPKLLSFLKKKISIRRAIINIVVVILIETALAFCVYLLNVPQIGGNASFVKWFTYIFPPFRVGDFFIGMNVAYIFMNMKAPKKVIVIVLELIAIVATVFTEFIQYTFQNNVNTDWFKYSLIYIIPVALLLYSFATNKGIIEKILNNRVVQFIADMSGYIFLLQVIVIWFVHYCMPKITHNYFDYIIQAVCAFILTTIAAFVWGKIESKVKKKLQRA